MELTGEEVSKIKYALLSDSFDQGLVELVGRQLTESEAMRTEEFLKSFDHAPVV